MIMSPIIFTVENAQNVKQNGLILWKHLTLFQAELNFHVRAKTI